MRVVQNSQMHFGEVDKRCSENLLPMSLLQNPYSVLNCFASKGKNRQLWQADLV